MLSYMLPTEDKPPPGDSNQGNYRASKLQKSPRERPPIASKPAGKVITVSPKKYVDSSRSIMIVSTKIEEHEDGDQQNRQDEQQQHHGVSAESPKHNGTVVKKSTLHTAKVTKDDSLYSINSDASTVGSDRKTKMLFSAKHCSLKKVSFGSSKGSMVETLVYETPVQEEPEINRFMDHNGRIPSIIASVPDTDEGREMVRVSLLGPQPSPTTPGVFQVQPIAISRTQPIDMDTVPAELLTTHTEHTAPAYHTQISTDSGWDNPFRPDGDLSREADEIVELIKGGKPITPTPGQTAPPLPGCDNVTSNVQTTVDHDSSSSPLLKSSANSTNRLANSSPKPGQENGNAHGTPMKAATANSQQPVNDKVVTSSRAATVEVARMTAQGPGDASQVEHVTLKKKPKCKCCLLQ
ncbi:PREDICTED: uncharacterized protein LOC108545925 isoform X2 [Eufriesea mexicana]|uniref:uncharacterized protein LOC108545925 isoform X2 n=2 Tax=Eufriesea mexicana TaxID=516756 RepID=UPI00083C1337|nr:PREDICTED: uncharacterized protein LOC108545925 isoform X2 [Eufriesea mexicana]